MAGFADDLLSITALAARCPTLVAPAMDGGMYANPATVKERGGAERARHRHPAAGRRRFASAKSVRGGCRNHAARRDPAAARSKWHPLAGGGSSSRRAARASRSTRCAT
ncbi:MAG: flavoprotein [Anaerolineae bacterium]